MTVAEQIRALDRSIQATELGISSLSRDVFMLNGMSSPKVRRLLNNLGSYHKRYLEVGTWRGSTAISATYGNKNLEVAVAIDDFSQFERKEIFNVNPLINYFLDDNEQKRFLYLSTPLEELTEKLQWLSPRVQFHEGDFKSPEIQDKLKTYEPFDLYLFDGEHSYQSQYDGVADMIQYMEPNFTLCVDDWTMDENSEVRRGTFDALRDCGAKICAHWSGPSEGNGDIHNYWNGFWVGVIEKKAE